MTTTDGTASRRRGDALRAAIFAAVLDQLDTVGYARLSTNGVAAAAGTGKAALYRRWRNKEELVVAALRDLLAPPPDLPPGTPLRDGLLVLLRYFDQTMFDSKGTAFQAVSAAGDDGTAALRTLFETTVALPCRERIADLARRHDPPPDADLAAIAAVGPAMLVQHCVSGRPRSTPEEIERVVDAVLLPLLTAR
ncbi:TetR family transcriptional regulator [Actinomadura flavalba]|uniref:TetR family transcriptional regulator n=1 Tax=Actinomadura flavalba TaxID=1120938 RepID=UPI00036F956B|nr:TetR family transcriptional regulator [Actinomadura flavalba]